MSGEPTGGEQKAAQATTDATRETTGDTNGPAKRWAERSRGEMVGGGGL